MSETGRGASGRLAPPEAAAEGIWPQSRAVAAGQEFAALYETEMPKLVRFVMKHGALPAEAADAAQAAFSAAWEAWEQIREPRAWLRTVAMREHMRRPVNEIPLEDCSDQTAPSPILDPLELGEQEQKVMAALATLPMKQRQVMAWHYDGFSHDQIASHMRITEEAVRQNLHRARARLRELLLGSSTEGRAE